MNAVSTNVLMVEIRVSGKQHLLRYRWFVAIFWVHEIVLQNEDSKKSIGVDWLRRLANAGLFVACDLAGQQKLGWFVLAHAGFLFIGQAKANHWKSLNRPWRGPSLYTANVQLRTIPTYREPQEGRVSYL
ncbi:hypothetical protein HBR94_10575 [Pseudomonas sp. WS 5412]|uniref:hypothetical protein n=1 Tax=Pseudomonas sp. WS 5412 TaxID=2717487 RepID=UPI001475811E|nr:hypothetical protein [Pseudomonas sp. WS 5412]NMY31943.1 hypothetical protein [Pseudomonas sp. WS 5412]